MMGIEGEESMAYTDSLGVFLSPWLYIIDHQNSNPLCFSPF